jgi:hypothetical protein
MVLVNKIYLDQSKTQPDLSEEYDVVGFVAENCIV